MKVLHIPKELLDIILEYDGRIKYKNGKYVNIIHKYDPRYFMLAPVIHKKTIIMKSVQFTGNGFYFEFHFDNLCHTGLCYDYNFFREKPVEICYYDFRYTWIQIRTYLL